MLKRILSLIRNRRKRLDPYGIEAGCQRIKEMRLKGFARPYKRRAR